MTTEIFAKGGTFVVDSVDAPLIRQYPHWYVDKRGYAYTVLPDGTYLNAHHVILPSRDGYDVDHEDRNALNNRRVNLRYLTHADNVANCVVRRHSRSGTKGVRFHRQSGTWTALGTFNGKQRAFGYYSDKATAAAVAIVGHRWSRPALYPEFSTLLTMFGCGGPDFVPGRRIRKRDVSGHFIPYSEELPCLKP